MQEEKTFNFKQIPGEFKKKKLAINSGKPLISIITAYYNSKEYIRQTANSVLNQTFPYWEWIIVNDGSTEVETSKILDDLQKEDKRIKVFNIQNSGPAKARLYGVNKSTTDLIFIFDSDDVIDETFLECGYFSMLTNPDASWCYSNIVNFDKKGNLYKKEFYSELEKKANVICGNSIIRKDKFLEVDYVNKDDTENLHEDWQLWLKLLQKNCFPIRMNYYGFWYRQRNGVLQSINNDKQKDSKAKKIIKNLAKKVKFSTTGIQFPETDNSDYKNYYYQFEWKRNPIVNSKEKKNLLFIFPWFTVGGADKFNLDLIKGLDKNKFNITIVTTEISDYIWRQKAEQYATIFDLNTFLNRKDWGAFLSYLIKSRCIDLVMISNSQYGYSILPWLKNQFPKVVFTDYLHAEDFSWRNGGFPRDSVDYERIIDKTFTCTKHLINVMYEKMDKKIKNTKTIYIGVDEEKFNSEIKPKKDFIEFKNKKIILYICRICELKRPIFAIKLMQLISEERNDIVLFVVGSGPELKEMKQIAKKLKINNKIVFFGMQEDTHSFYSCANVTLICSLTEGLTITTYESLSMGVPVVSSDVGGQNELIDDKCGKIIKTYQSIENDLYNRDYSIEELKEYKTAIYEIIDNKDYNKNSSYCRDKIIKNFTISSMVKNMSEEIENLISKGTLIKSKNIYSEKECNKILLNYIKTYPRLIYVERNKYKRIINSFLSDLKDRLWQFKTYRLFIEICDKIGLIKLKKMVLRRK